MAKVPRFLAPEPWENKDLYLYHGTLDLHVKSIRKGVNVERGALGRDFGRGFYTTTQLTQARSWAWQVAQDYNDSRRGSDPMAAPVVVSFRVNRDDLSRLDCLAFVRGDYEADDYWSLVHHCRLRRPGHGRHTYPELGEWYDVVIGPVAAVWRTRLALADCDQFSFHTQAGADLLNGSPKRAVRVRWS
jgi:hypothetical protein